MTLPTRLWGFIQGIAVVWMLATACLPARGQTSVSQEDANLGTARTRPVVRTIAPEAYDGNGEVWDVAQDERGLLYIASSYGLRQYDGARWRDLPTANQTTPWSIARAADGRLYVGARGELGRYRPDSIGRLRYESLLDAVPKSHRPVGNVREVTTADSAVLFQAQSGVLRWTGTEMHAVTDTTDHLLDCRQRAYVQTPDGPVRRVRTSTLRRVPNGEVLRDASIAALYEHGDTGCQVVTEDGRRFVLGDSVTRARPLPVEVGSASVVDVMQSAGGALAVATKTDLYLAGPRGTRHRLQRGEELPDGRIKALYVSSRTALWVATSSGVARVAWPDPVSVLSGPPEHWGTIRIIVRHDGRRFAGTERGVWEWKDGTAERVTPAGTVVTLLSTSAGLLAAQNNGIFVVRAEGRRQLSGTYAYSLHRSRSRSSRVYVGLYGDGLLELRQTDGQWQVVDSTRRVQTPIYTMAEDTSGALWLGTGHRGILRLGPPAASLDAAPLTRLDTTDGLPAPSFNYTVQLGDTVRFITRDGLYRPAGDSVEPDPRFAPVYDDGIYRGWPVVPGAHNEVWMDFGGHKLGVATLQQKGPVRWTDRPFRRLSDFGDVVRIHPEGDSLVWFSAEEALVRYDRRLQAYGGHAQPFRTLIRGVQTRADSVLYAGDAEWTRLPAAVGYDHNALRFQFGSTSYERLDGPSFDRERPRQYRWKLAGYDNGWTDWTTEPRADYTGLSPGTYTMHVQARNLYNRVGREDTISFTILPPWYRTWRAYLGYLLFGIGAVAGIVQWRTRRLQRQKEELEATVAERTEEVREQRDRLEQQAEQLKALDDAKSRFFANISHEFRTPLTLLLGPLEQLRDAAAARGAEDEREHLNLMERNLQRLRRLINQVLDLAELDADRLTLNARPLAIADEVTRIVRAFEPLADRQNLDLHLDTEWSDDGPPVVADPEQLEHIVSNLLSNALKFTPTNEQVTVRVRSSAEAGIIEVTDTGPGIPPEQRETLFDRFTQTEDSHTRDEEGSGIGLALVKELVDLHGGSIAVDSTVGEGTTFTVRLLRGDDHLSAEHLGDATDPEIEPPESIPTEADDRSAVPGATSPDADRKAEADDPDETSDRTTVLVVDDNADVRRYVRSVLASDFRVRTAADGTAGLAAAREHQPDCLLADVMMPKMDGMEMVQALRDDRATDCIPILMLTSRAATEDELEGLGAGADDYITKPFDPDVLQARIHGQIELRRRLRRRIREELAARSGDGQTPDEPPSGNGHTDSASDASGEPPQLVVPTPSANETEFVARVREAVEDHLADPDLTVEELASEVAASRSTLYRRLKDEADCTPTAFIRQVRVEHGARLLREQEGTISEVAYAVGFNSLTYFSRSFREHVGVAPSEFVKRDV